MATIHKTLEARAPLSDRDCDELCDLLVKIDAGRYRVVRKKVVSPRPVKPDLRAGRREQGRLAVEYCDAMPASLSDNAKATRLIDQFSNYRSSAWKYESALAEAPQGRHGIFWRMLKAYDHVPCVKTILRKLDSSRKAARTVQQVGPC